MNHSRQTESYIALARWVAEALGSAHARGVVHRDVTPGNVFLTNRNIDEAKVVDFGIARWDAMMYSMTATGLAVGTPSYMAPEQVRCDQDIDARADVFALGCLLFECLTGRGPFADANVMAVLAKIAWRGGSTAERDPQQRPSRNWMIIVARMLTKNRARLRPADGGNVVAAETCCARSHAPDAAGPLPQGNSVSVVLPDEQRLLCAFCCCLQRAWSRRPLRTARLPKPCAPSWQSTVDTSFLSSTERAS